MTTANTLQADKILADIEVNMDGVSHVLTYDVENPDAVRQQIYKRGGSFRQDVKVATISEYRHNLIVNIKAERREQKLERYLRKALLHIDDEAFYEEVLHVLDGQI